MSFSVAGKTAVVTGSASGINLAFAKLLASKGSRVVAADLQETPALRDFLEASGPSNVVFKKTDVADWKQLDELFEFAKSTFKTGVDVMCNGAGIYEPSWSNFWTDTETSSYATIDINLSALMRGTRLAIRDQVTRSPAPGSSPGNPDSSTTASARTTVGVILNVSSLAAQFALLNQPLYGASKAAVSSFTRSLAPLHGLFGIKVVAVAPGMVNTPLWTNYPEKIKAVSWNEEDVVLEPEELADAMLRLVEGEDYEGGTVLEVLAEGKTRRVEVDSPVADGKGATMSRMHLVTRDTVEILRREQATGRGGGRRE